MRPSLKHFDVAYLYEDGHAVVCYRDRKPNGLEVEWAEVYERYVHRTHFAGRIVFHRAARMLFQACYGNDVEATVPTLEHGSQNTRDHGLPVGSFCIYPVDVKGHRSDYYPLFELDLIPWIAQQITYDDYQAGRRETWADVAEEYGWSTRQILKKHPAASAS